MKRNLFAIFALLLLCGGCASKGEEKVTDPLYAPTDPSVGKTERPRLGGPGADLKAAPVSPD
jgi:hypothetical protein